MIGRLKRVPLREVWKHEAADFTRWLTENPDVLSDLIDLPLQNLERETAAGSFSCDIRAEDANGNIVVIENQLEKSNHDHLGKLITYATALGARVAIWIVSEPRPEHVAAINWLNEGTSAAFYILKIEAVKIGDSQPAPLLTLITGPSDETAEAGRTKQEVAVRHVERRAFWQHLLERLKTRTSLFANVSPGQANWISTGTGKSGVIYSLVVRQEDTSVEVYIDRKDPIENRRIFDALETEKSAIEKAFGGQLEWQPLEDRKACRIRYTMSKGGYRTPDKWPDVFEAMIDALIRLESAFRPHIVALNFV